MNCPHCSSMTGTPLSRKTSLGYKVFRCSACRRTFNERTGTMYNHLQFPTDIVLLVVLWRLRAKRGFVLLPRRWVVERSFAWATRFRRLARDYERLPEMLAGLHFVAFAMLLAARFVQLVQLLNPQGCGCS